MDALESGRGARETATRTPTAQRSRKLLLLVVFAMVLTTILQSWVGPLTIYSPQLQERRLELHQAILVNEPPRGGTWGAAGANGVNVRVFTVYLAEAVHRISGLSLHRSYRLLDSACLFAIFLSVFAYLRYWFDPVYCLVGVLYLTAALVLTYHFGYFHPWDRIALLAWIGMLALLRAGRVLAFACLLVVSVTIKPDAALLPVLLGMCSFERPRWLKTLLPAIGLLALGLGTGVLLRVLVPGGFDADQGPLLETLAYRLSRNAAQLRNLDVSYPPLLAFVLPGILAFAGLMRKGRFVISNVLFAVLMFVPYVLLSNFHEVRAQMPMLVLILPAALMGLRALLGEEEPELGKALGS